MRMPCSIAVHLAVFVLINLASIAKGVPASVGRVDLSKVVSEAMSDIRASSEGFIAQTARHEGLSSSDSLREQLVRDEIRRERKLAQNRESALRAKLRRKAEKKGVALELDPSFYARRKAGPKIKHVDDPELARRRSAKRESLRRYREERSINGRSSTRLADHASSSPSQLPSWPSPPRLEIEEELSLADYGW